MENDGRAEPTRREDDYRFGRIIAISDGVFAFSLTLLVVTLVAPTATSNSALLSQLGNQWPELISYLLSFSVVAVTWYSHHETFRFIRHADGKLILLNFACLLLVAFLPFPTAVLGRNQGLAVAAVVYAVTLTLVNFANAALWWYATRARKLVDRDLDRHVVKRRFLRLAIGALVFLSSIPVAFWQPRLAEAMWFPLFGINLVISTERRTA